MFKEHMMITQNLKRTPEARRRYFTALGAAAQLALVLGIFLGRLEIQNLDFLIGMLYGFSIVGNLAFLMVVSQKNYGG
jgi:hypothetical protein